MHPQRQNRYSQGMVYACAVQHSVRKARGLARAGSIFLLFPLFLMNIFFCYSNETYHNPFITVLPLPEVKVETRVEAEPDSAAIHPREDISPPEMLKIRVEGIVWGGVIPQAIIDGSVYREGDMLKTMEAKIEKIEEGTVFISYMGSIYPFGTVIRR